MEEDDLDLGLEDELERALEMEEGGAPSLGIVLVSLMADSIVTKIIAYSLKVQASQETTRECWYC